MPPISWMALSHLSGDKSTLSGAPWGWPSRGGAVLYQLSPQLGEDPPPPWLRTRGYVILRGSRDGSVGSVSTVDRCVVGSSPRGAEHFGSPSAPRLGNQRPWYMSSLVYATGHVKYLVRWDIEKRWGLSPGGRFPPSFIHQVIIITGLN